MDLVRITPLSGKSVGVIGGLTVVQIAVQWILPGVLQTVSTILYPILLSARCVLKIVHFNILGLLLLPDFLAATLLARVAGSVVVPTVLGPVTSIPIPVEVLTT